MKYARFPSFAMILTVSLALICGRALAKDTQEFASTKPVPRNDAWWQDRHKSMNERVKKGNVDLLMIGDSITHGWEGGGKDVWKKFYEKRNAVNLGIGGDQTQHVLWRLENGNIDGIQPKLAVLMIGTNNAGCGNPQEIAAGVQAIVEKLRAKLPQMKVLRAGDLPPRGRHARTAFARSTRRPMRLSPNWLTTRTSSSSTSAPSSSTRTAKLPRDIMPDLLHPNAKGYEIWAEAIEPSVKKLMGE